MIISYFCKKKFNHLCGMHIHMDYTTVNYKKLLQPIES